MKFRSKPEVEQYFVRRINSRNISIPGINFMIIDQKELTVAIPGIGKRDAVISIKNIEIIRAFDRYYELIWSVSTDY
ncbi:MAG: hypothetical protein AAFQ80_25415 [Cyanobacteria bacterium J06621_8]